MIVEVLGVTCDFGVLWKQQDFLTSYGNKILNGPYFQELLDIMFSPATLAIIDGTPGHSKIDSLEAKRNHLSSISRRNATLTQTSVMVQRGISKMII